MCTCTITQLMRAGCVCGEMNATRKKAVWDTIRKKVIAGDTDRSLLIAQKMRARLFRQQLEFVDDPERHKALLCPRRAGKSYALAAYIMIQALEHPNSNIVYIARTRDKAKEILWDGDGENVVSLKKINKDFEIGIHFSEVHTSGRLPNGSTFRLRGCETIADIEQFRGEPFHLVVVDEAGTFALGVLDPLLDRAIEPTLGDYQGTVVLAGTPGPIMKGRWHDVSHEPVACEVKDHFAKSRPYNLRDDHKWYGIEYGWSFHSWTRQDNIILPHLWNEALKIKRLNGWSDHNPTWIREYLGRWIPDDSNLVYKFDPQRNTWKKRYRSEEDPFGLPPGHEWNFVAGMDFGHKDPFALSVLAYSPTHPHIFQVYEFVAAGLLPKDFAEAIDQARSILPPGKDLEWMAGDFGGFGELLQEQMSQEYGHAIEKALKKDKLDHINLLNSDLVDGRCFLLEGSKVAEQMLYLSWDDTGLKEKSGMRNDACDAVVYTWRQLRFHEREEVVQALEPGSPEFEQALDREQAAAYIANRYSNQRDGDQYSVNGDEGSW